MKFLKSGLIALIISLGFSSLAVAQIFYGADGDDDTTYIIDLDAGTFTSFNTGALDAAFAMGVSGSILMSDRDNENVMEFTLDGVPTGNTWVAPGGFDQLLDGTTDGQGNYYGASWSGVGVSVSGPGFTDTTTLFDPGYDVIGIAYDTSNDTLWLVNDDNGMVINYTLGGVEQSDFAPSLNGRECCLAYDEATDTLWLSTNEGNTISNYAKNGDFIKSVTIDGYDPRNNFGGEIQIGNHLPDSSVAAPVPTMSTWAVVLLILAMFGLLASRRPAYLK